MCRQRRCIISKQVYEVCFRTAKGLPFVTTLYMAAIINGIVARVQRDLKVHLCHALWMANHCHMIIVTRDARACSAFYGEVQKQLTEAIKRLFGKSHLKLWEPNDTSVIRYGDVESVIERIAYLYANPARAHLVDSISRYPGVSSWSVFENTPNTLRAKSKSHYAWLRQPCIKPLPSTACSPAQDRTYTEKLLSTAKVDHPLCYEPNIWMAAFGLEDSDVADINQRILDRLKAFEDEARDSRCQKGFRAKGASKLSSEPLSLAYRPKKHSRRIFIYASNPQIRKEMIQDYRDFCDECSRCYERWRVGDFTTIWPPGAILPAPPQLVNWVLN